MAIIAVAFVTFISHKIGPYKRQISLYLTNTIKRGILVKTVRWDGGYEFVLGKPKG